MASKVCSKCGAPAVILVKYSGQHLCRAHFLEFTERRMKKDLRKQGPYPAGSRIAVALSGGKDSIVLLHLVREVFAENPRVSVVALTVDEGIAQYRPESIRIAREACERLGVEHVVVSYAEEAGHTMDGIVGSGAPGLPCSYCGPLRRRSLNAAAKRVGATHLATGHNLDDTAQTVLMNYVRGDLDRMARMGPHPAERVQPGLVPRVMPLRSVPEKEVALYAILKGYAFHEGECPYARDATRGRFRDMLLALEEAEPGARHALVAGFDRLAPLLSEGVPGSGVRECSRCGETTSAKRRGVDDDESGGAASGALCKACELLASLRKPASSLT